METNRSEWIETTAKIISCRYQFARMNTLTMGVDTGEKFRISFEYYAHGRSYSGEFQSPVAVPQGDRINIRYNPMRPEENSYSAGSRSNYGRGLLAAGVTVSVVLSLLWLGFVRGCG